MSLSLLKFKPDANIETKVNFFADYFNHLNKNLGKYSYLEFETPLSLCSKVAFQIEENPQRRVEYLNYHLKHDFFDANDFTYSFKYYKKLHPFIDEYLREGKGERKEKSKKDKWITDNPIFLRTTKKYINELEVRQIEVVTKMLIKMLSCRCKLKDHKESIIYLIRIIVSHLRFSDKREKEIENLIGSLINKNNGFPLPKSIRFQKGKEKYDEMVKTFFEELNLEAQFRGIVNFEESNKNVGYNLIRIHKLQLSADESIKYGSVEIFNPNNKKLDAIKAKSQEKDVKILSSEAFVNTKDTSIAVVEGLWNDKRTLRQSIIEVQKAIDHINLKLELNSYLDPYEIRWTSDFEGMNYLGNLNKIIELSEDDMEKVKDDNLFQLLNDNPSNAAKRLLSAEKFYHRAQISNDVSDYWHYLECIIPLKKLANGKYDKQVKSACASILLVNRKGRFHNDVSYDLFWLLRRPSLNYSEKNFLSDVELNSLFNDWVTIYKKAASFECYPIVKELRKIYKERNLIDNIKNEYKYFYGIFHELYEIRNTYIHGGVTNGYAEKKLSLIVPKLIELIRGEILLEVEKRKRIEMEEVIEKIVAKSRKYCPYKIEKGELIEITS